MSDRSKDGDAARAGRLGIATLADYRCGCTWIGRSSACSERCSKHGEPRRAMHRITDVPLDQQGWRWKVEIEDGQGDANP
jgi:hypothetical protein